MKIAIFGLHFNDAAIPFVKSMFHELLKRQIDIMVYDIFQAFLREKSVTDKYFSSFNTSEDLKGVDLLFSMGGDGTLLQAITYIGNKEIPVLGINTGTLGFLATTPKHQIANDLEKIFNGEYVIEDRILVKLNAEKDIFNGTNYGLNEFSILKKDTSSMIVVHTYLDEVFLNSYWADGLIVSTPTGSTGYSLSCGGPVVMPTSNSFIITPVSPHNLNVRPLVVSDKSEISFEIEGRNRLFLVSLDSRSKTIDSEVKISVVKENFKVKLLKLKDYEFLNTLRSKLNWGMDVRNHFGNTDT